jgi:hypothetical protein
MGQHKHACFSHEFPKVPLFLGGGQFPVCRQFGSYPASRDDILIDAAKRYRVNAEKLQKTVAKEFAAKTRPEGNQAEGSQDDRLS